MPCVYGIQQENAQDFGTGEYGWEVLRTGNHFIFIAKKAFELIVEEALGPRTNRGQTDQHDVSYSF